MKAWRVFALILALSVLFSTTADAHGTGVSRAEYVVDDQVVHASLFFRRDELSIAFGDHSELGIAKMLHVDVDGAPCVLGPPTISDEPPDGSRISLDLTCPTAPTRLHIDSAFIDRFAAGHTHLITVTRGSQKSEALALLAKPDVRIEIGRQKRAFFEIVQVGVQHILTGYDHLAFLFALLLVPPDREVKKRVWALLGVLTAFTIGHTLSLGVASLGGWVPSSRIVEPAIALSIAYVAAENFFVKGWRHRWMLTFPFGLIHGFGFASGLLDLAVDRADLPRALFGFNLGVEIGQLGVLAIALPLVLLAQRYRWYMLARRVASGVIVVLGVVWFVLRVAMV